MVGFLYLNYANAQNSTNSTGGEAIGLGGKSSYSIGVLVYKTDSSNTGNIEQGIQHAFEIYTIGINETEFNISLSIFPNPTNEQLTLQIFELNDKKLFYNLLDVNSKLLLNRRVLGKETVINLQEFPSSTYILKIVSEENKIIQTFKIIKN